MPVKKPVINLDVEGDQATIGVYLTSKRAVKVRLATAEEIVFESEITLSPERTLREAICLPEGVLPHQLTLTVLSQDELLISYSPAEDGPSDIPEAATAARLPGEIDSNDELFLNGLHLEQYRHATYQPEPYYLEALRRDPNDSRCNNAMGLLLLRRGKFRRSRALFQSSRQEPDTAQSKPLQW